MKKFLPLSLQIATILFLYLLLMAGWHIFCQWLILVVANTSESTEEVKKIIEVVLWSFDLLGLGTLALVACIQYSKFIQKTPIKEIGVSFIIFGAEIFTFGLIVAFLILKLTIAQLILYFGIVVVSIPLGWIVILKLGHLCWSPWYEIGKKNFEFWIRHFNSLYEETKERWERSQKLEQKDDTKIVLNSLILSLIAERSRFSTFLSARRGVLMAKSRIAEKSGKMKFSQNVNSKICAIEATENENNKAWKNLLFFRSELLKHEADN